MGIDKDNQDKVLKQAAAGARKASFDGEVGVMAFTHREKPHIRVDLLRLKILTGLCQNFDYGTSVVVL